MQRIHPWQREQAHLSAYAQPELRMGFDIFKGPHSSRNLRTHKCLFIFCWLFCVKIVWFCFERTYLLACYWFTLFVDGSVISKCAKGKDEYIFLFLQSSYFFSCSSFYESFDGSNVVFIRNPTNYAYAHAVSSPMNNKQFSFKACQTENSEAGLCYLKRINF